jgi:hypothetical protein
VSGAPPPTEPKPRLELVITSDHGIESVPPPPGDREPTGKIASVRPPAPTPVASSAIETAPEREKPPSTVHDRVATSVLGATPFGEREAKMIRSLARTAGLTGLFSVAIGSIVIAQIAYGRINVIAVVAGVLVGAIGFWSLLAGYHFQRVGKSGREDAAQLVASFGNLRSIFLLKAIGLFLVLALSCFAFSVVASLLALL